MVAFKKNQFIHESVSTFQNPGTSRCLSLFISRSAYRVPVLLYSKPTSLCVFPQQFNHRHIKRSEMRNWPWKKKALPYYSF